MNRETADKLAAINRAFYRERADEFDASRQDPWPGWRRVLACLEAGPPPGPPRVLDVGCGNARFASFLDRELAARDRTFDYVGVDASDALLDRARSRALSAGRAELLCADWDETSPERALPAGPFDLVALFGVLHHVPGSERRRALLASAAGRLAPGGLLAVTTWRFASAARFRRRLMPWADYNRSARCPVDPAQLEPGDRLVRWGDANAGAVRYCHFADDEEIERLTRGLGLRPIDSFLADGREADLNRYLVLRAGA